MIDKSNPLAGQITTYFSIKTTHKPHGARVEHSVSDAKRNASKLSSLVDSIPLKRHELNEEDAEKWAFLKVKKKRPEGRFSIGSAFVTNAAFADQ
ncbi:hypothetical protein [Rouxiella badensis]|uniref:hypothetical protein n=1 Tax=Rouxiella badensis TaxID=1646377 RepID=UPI00111C2078|nr:hypothetical protein [Rouxiella badensis]MCC3702959.1 hypothetical protein [Rouxiella badensis]MCC3720287.1 hypothetical protein [Rouxiella badensis]MCC3729950.1 hypothetical protein [Rouxiella badensis]MCC3733867.1 hypothetical protein [Rouxiella badensis]MCC3741437.1 hypothetical protein [Rouxiella badensis]